MEPSGQPANGVFASVRRLADTCLSAVQNRIELFALELQEEKQWLIATLLWSAAAIFFGGVAVILLTLTVLLLAPEPARPWFLVGFCLVFLGLAIWAFVGLRRQFRQPPPFADTMGELKKDISWVRQK